MLLLFVGYLVPLFMVMPVAPTTTWEDAWIRGVQPANQEKFMDLKVLKDLRTAASADFTKKPLPWYTPADLSNPRLEPLCSLKVMHFKSASDWKIDFCSCSFVKPDMVATAAHCLTASEVTPKSEHAIWVQQRYGQGNDKDYGKYKVNMVAEWWYPFDFLLDNEIHMDIAFLRTKESAPLTSTYTMRVEYEKGSYNVEAAKAWVIGYPSDVANYQLAVYGNGKLRTKSATETMFQNTYQVTKASDRPLMEKGSSGGPIILSDTTLAEYTAQGGDWKKAAELLRMGLLGVNGRAMRVAPFNENYAIKFTPTLIKVAEMIYSKGTNGADVNKKTDGTELVKLKGI